MFIPYTYLSSYGSVGLFGKKDYVEIVREDLSIHRLKIECGE